MSEPISSIVVDGNSYPLKYFSEQVQEAVALRNRWQAELDREKEAALKTEAAIRQIDRELASLVQQELSK